MGLKVILLVVVNSKKEIFYGNVYVNMLAKFVY